MSGNPERTFDVSQSRADELNFQALRRRSKLVEIEFSSGALMLKIPAPAELHKDSIDEMECR